MLSLWILGSHTRAKEDGMRSAQIRLGTIMMVCGGRHSRENPAVTGCSRYRRHIAVYLFSGRQVGDVEWGTYDIDTTDYSQEAEDPQGFAQNNLMLPPIDYNQYGSLYGGAGATGSGSVDPAMYMNFGDGSYAPMPGAGEEPPTQAEWDAIMSMNPGQGGGGYQNNSDEGSSRSHEYPPPPRVTTPLWTSIHVLYCEKEPRKSTGR
ncbi:hypothetical protein L198_00659 [Cryptococcus wingfieldii CBS 7118]|uniref:Uncharacterized protein n=1 Tax=Cryptococcus wingfieldii CBS 7118 TaxID=1295528 RepID=A0A1E3K705_9TREE|nr:hypothetical protein L198_00659 [Cryptococcus wingfieldii CBS 7118]ODO08920.1 hypothetical protein L198_00659 [Cryptococcus wingfieldii CBS 7118]